MIFEDILTCAEKVKATGEFLRNLDPGDMERTREEFLDDVGALLVKTAEEIEGYCRELEEETKGTGEAETT
jgi:hypothetical protein